MGAFGLGAGADGNEPVRAIGKHPALAAPYGRQPSFSEDDAQRARFPLADGALDYFPNAIAAVAEISRHGSEKHNAGQPMHWARDKSTNHADKVLRHLADRGLKDADGYRHSAYAAWRMLALLQTELEEAGECPPSRASRFGTTSVVDPLYPPPPPPLPCPIEAATMPELRSELFMGFAVGDRVRVRGGALPGRYGNITAINPTDTYAIRVSVDGDPFNYREAFLASDLEKYDG